MCRLHAWRLHSVEFSVTSVLVAKFLPHFLCRLLSPSLFFIVPRCHCTSGSRNVLSFCKGEKNNQNRPFGIKSTPDSQTIWSWCVSCRCLLLIIFSLCVLDLRKLGCHQNHDKEPWGFQKGAKEKSPDERRADEGTSRLSRLTVMFFPCFFYRQVYLTVFVAGEMLFRTPLETSSRKSCMSFMNTPNCSPPASLALKNTNCGWFKWSERVSVPSNCGRCPAIGPTNRKNSSLFLWSCDRTRSESASVCGPPAKVQRRPDSLQHHSDAGLLRVPVQILWGGDEQEEAARWWTRHTNNRDREIPLSFVSRYRPVVVGFSSA